MSVPKDMTPFASTTNLAFAVPLTHLHSYVSSPRLQNPRSLRPDSPNPHVSTTRSGAAVSMVAKPENEPDAKLSATVERLYDTYPFPPESLLDEPPLGYNWRWHYQSVHAFCTGRLPVSSSPNKQLRILDAGCGTGESTTYLVHQNPSAQVVAVDLSAQALDVAKERLQRALPDHVSRCDFHHLSLFDLADLDGQFDLINCVGVIHHTPDPARALRALADKLAPGGICHIFVYGAHGRWEISLMQKALRLLQSSRAPESHDQLPQTRFQDGVSLGRRVFAALPDDNRLKLREQQRWAQENKKDATFADMYLHPQEVDYDIDSLFDLIDGSGLDFVAFSNPSLWDPTRLLAKDEQLLQTAQQLPLRQRLRLMELLDPEAVTHFEFFLSKPPLERIDWSDHSRLSNASASISPCISGWPGTVVLDKDYMAVSFSPQEHAFLLAIDSSPRLSSSSPSSTVGPAAKKAELSLDGVRRLVDRGIVLLSSS